MVRVEGSHRYDVTVEDGFAFITNPDNWPRFWPGFVRLDPSSRWGAVGDEARLTVKLLGREVELVMHIDRYERNRLITYSSVQRGLPDVHHERHFEPDGDGFVYRLVTEHEPRRGAQWLYDRLVVPAGIRRAFRTTFADLERELHA